MIRVHADLKPLAVEGADYPALFLLPGRVAVLMAEVPKEKNGLILPDRTSKKIRPSVATVIAVGAGVPLCLGATVLVHPRDGKRIEGFTCGEYEAGREVRLYGVTAPLRGEALRVPWWESVMASVEETGTIRAHGFNVWLELGEKREQSAGGIILPDAVQDRDDIGTVVSIGGLCKELPAVAQLGDRVLFNRRSLKQIDYQDGRAYGLIHEDGVFGRMA